MLIPDTTQARNSPRTDPPDNLTSPDNAQQWTVDTYQSTASRLLLFTPCPEKMQPLVNLGITLTKFNTFS